MGKPGPEAGAAVRPEPGSAGVWATGASGSSSRNIAPDSSTEGVRACAGRTGAGSGAGAPAAGAAGVTSSAPGGGLSTSPGLGSGRLLPGTQAEPFQ